MKKTIICGLALSALALLSTLPAEAAKQDNPNAVESKSTETAMPVINDYVEASDIFKTATLHRDQLTSEYRLAKYDVIQISILGFPNGLGYSTGSTDSNGDTIAIGPDGYAALPYVGSVKLVGLTLDEAGELIKEKLSRYIKIPSIVVSMRSYGPRKVYVMGEVNSPGIKDMSIDNLNAYAAISSAGGFTKRGRSTRVQVIRVIDNVMYYRQLNMKGFIKRHDLTQNVAIQDGDIVYVPKSNAILWKEDILPYLQTFVTYKAVVD